MKMFYILLPQGEYFFNYGRSNRNGIISRPRRQCDRGTVMRVAIKTLNSLPRAFILTPFSYSVSVFAAGLYIHRYPLPKLQKAHILYNHGIIHCKKCKYLFFECKNFIRKAHTAFYSTIRYMADSAIKLAVAGRIASQKPTPTRSFSAGSASRARMLRGSSNHTTCARPAASV